MLFNIMPVICNEFTFCLILKGFVIAEHGKRPLNSRGMPILLLICWHFLQVVKLGQKYRKMRNCQKREKRYA